MPNTVTLLTDFGLDDSYVAEVKAILISLHPNLRIIDLTHTIAPYQIQEAGFQLLRSYRFFPVSTYHLVVVDPGVGTPRKCLYVRSRDYHFVGPDNGVLKWAVDDCRAREGVAPKIYEIPVASKTPATFHGRDIFAPFIVQHMYGTQKGLKEVSEIEGSSLPENTVLKNKVKGEILHVDRFGNAVTSILSEPGAAKAFCQVTGSATKIHAASNYSSIPKGKAGLIAGSHGFWELSVNQGSAAKKLRLKVGSKITVGLS